MRGRILSRSALPVAAVFNSNPIASSRLVRTYFAFACRLVATSVVVSLVILTFSIAHAHGAIFGTNPLNISVGPNGEAANAASGGPDISGDDRYGRLAVFHSDASNLVGNDGNGQRDVFVWWRPRGYSGLSLDQIGLGSLSLVSVSSSGRPANGPSQNPSVDGSMHSKPRCVAFQSQATNLANGDSSSDWDIYLRDLRRNRTTLVSRGVRGEATDPSISGNCRLVAFTSGGAVWTAKPGKKPHRVAGGSMPDYSLDGKSLAYRNSSGHIKFEHSGHSETFGTGTNPIVSDESKGGGWAVGFNSGGQVMLGTVKRSGHNSTSTVAGSDAVLGGVSAYAANRGIVTYAVGASLFYLNRHSGNSDDLAHANDPIGEAAASARANFVLFTSTGGGGFVEPAPTGAPSVPAIYVKHLVDGKTL